jgi:hypothetical protein
MEFVPRHPYAILPATGPDSLPGGAVVHSLGPLSPPDHFPACGETPPGHRQTHHTPDRLLPAACRVSASCREFPSPYRRWRTPARDNAGAHEPLPTGGTPLGMGLPTRGTHRLPGQRHRRLHRRLPERSTTDSEGLHLRRVVQPIRPHHARLRHGDMEEPPLQKVRHGQRHPLGRGGPRVGLLLPRARGEGDAGAVVRHQAAVLDRAAP